LAWHAATVLCTIAISELDPTGLSGRANAAVNVPQIDFAVAVQWLICVVLCPTSTPVK